MKYLCLVYHEEQKLAALSREQMETLVADCVDWAGGLERTGHLVHSAGLQTTATAATVRSQGGRVSVTDGPFAETKEFLSGYVLIEARDLNEAIQIASKFPTAGIGAVEVRPLLEADEQATQPLDQRIAAAFRKCGPASEKIASLPQA